MKFFGLCLAGVLMLTLLALLLSVPVYFLWNWLMPAIFGLKEITLLQALGLMILSNFLFKSTSYKSS